MSGFLGRIVALSLIALFGGAGLAHAGSSQAGAPLAGVCPADPPMASLSLPHLRAAEAEGREGVVVALGSSSTTGLAASASARTYPAILQAELAAALPDWHVAVLNRGISGQDARSELDRLETDVIAAHPQLVIWQVGANAAMHHDDSGAFQRLVTQGALRLEAAGIDVVLMDNQRAPRVLAAAEDAAMDHALAEAARQTGASLFSRDRLMSGWEAEGAPPATFIAADSLHHNDRGYLCVARSLAAAVVRALKPAAS